MYTVLGLMWMSQNGDFRYYLHDINLKMPELITNYTHNKNKINQVIK